MTARSLASPLERFRHAARAIVLQALTASPHAHGGRADGEARHYDVSESPDSLEYLEGSAVLRIAGSRLRYFGGVPFTPEHHHFLRYYREGFAALERYYATHRPSDIFGKHFLASPPGPSRCAGGVPWLEPIETRLGADRRLGEHGLGPEHGLQHYGPVSRAKLELEARRLDDVLASIRAHGYRPSIGGYPRGYFLARESGEWVFLVTGGQHRVAALVHLGRDPIPASFQPNFPRIVREADIENWPMVRCRLLSVERARAIFESYFRKSNLSLTELATP
jgi:hypothetical protein